MQSIIKSDDENESDDDMDEEEEETNQAEEEEEDIEAEEEEDIEAEDDEEDEEDMEAKDNNNDPPLPPNIDGLAAMMMLENNVTPDQSSSDWAEAIDGYLNGFHGPRAPSPAVSEGKELPDINGIARLRNDSDNDDLISIADDDIGYDGDDEANWLISSCWSDSLI